MELNGQQVGQYLPSGWLPFQSLNYSIYTNGISAQRFSNFCDRLVMSTIHPQDVFARHFSKQRANLQFYLMYHLIFAPWLGMISGPGGLLWDVHQQRPAQRHVQNLQATANG